MTDVQHLHCKAVQKPRPLRRSSSKSDSEGEAPVVVKPRPVHVKSAQKPRPLKISPTSHNETAAVLVKQELTEIRTKLDYLPPAPTDDTAAYTNGTSSPEVTTPEKVSPSYGPKRSQRTRLIDKSYDVRTEHSAAEGVLQDELGACFTPVRHNAKRETQVYFPVQGILKKDTQAKKETQECFPVQGDLKKEKQDCVTGHRDTTKELSPTKAEAPCVKYTQPLNMDKVKISRESDMQGSTSIARLSIPKAEGAAVENRKVTGFVAMVTGTDIVRINDEAVTFDIRGSRDQQDKAIGLILERCYDTDMAPNASRVRSIKHLSRQVSVPETLSQTRPPPTVVHRQVSVPNLQVQISNPQVQIQEQDTDTEPLEKATKDVTFGQRARRTRWGPELPVLIPSVEDTVRSENKTLEQEIERARRTRWGPELPVLIPSVEDTVRSENKTLEQEIEALQHELLSGGPASSKRPVQQASTAGLSAYMQQVVGAPLQDQPEPRNKHLLDAIPEADPIPMSLNLTRLGGGDTRELASSQVSPPVMTSPRTGTSPIPIDGGVSPTAKLPGSRLSPRLSNLLGRLKIRGRDMVSRGGQSPSLPVSPELLPLGDSDSDNSEKGAGVSTLEENLLVNQVGITGEVIPVLQQHKEPLVNEEGKSWSSRSVPFPTRHP